MIVNQAAVVGSLISWKRRSHFRTDISGLEMNKNLVKGPDGGQNQE
jgi:hypothetical protein